MKKVLLVMALVLPLMFTSCKSDDDEISLVGTEWYGTAEIDTYEYELYLSFLDKTTYQIAMWRDGEYANTYTGPYTLSGSSITITDSEGYTMSGTVKGNKINCTFYSEDGPVKYEFTKK